MTETKRPKLALLYRSPAPLPDLHRVGNSKLGASGTQLQHGGMDDNSRRRRHNEPPMHPSSNPRYPQQTLHDPSQQQQQQQQRRSYGQQPTDRFRPSPLNAPTTATGRGMGGSAGYGTTGYYQDTGTTGFPSTGMPQGAMGYHQPGAEYGQAGDTRQSQGFSASTYNPTAMMYNVQGGGGAQNPAAAAAAVYDTTSQQFSSRPPAAAMQMMPPDVGASYFPNEPTNATGAASGMQPQAAPSTQALYQPSGLSNYSGGIASMGGMAAAAAQPPPPAAAGPPDVSMEEQESSASTGLEEAWATYQTELRGVFRNVQDGVLAAASESLLNLSDWLLSHVSDLGTCTSKNSTLYLTTSFFVESKQQD